MFLLTVQFVISKLPGFHSQRIPLSAFALTVQFVMVAVVLRQ